MLTFCRYPAVGADGCDQKAFPALKEDLHSCSQFSSAFRLDTAAQRLSARVQPRLRGKVCEKVIFISHLFLKQLVRVIFWPSINWWYILAWIVSSEQPSTTGNRETDAFRGIRWSWISGKTGGVLVRHQKMKHSRDVYRIVQISYARQSHLPFLITW